MKTKEKSSLLRLLIIFIGGFGALTVVSCNENNYTVVEQKTVRGKVSAIDDGYGGRFAKFPRLYIQDNKQTQVVEVSFQDRDLFHVGDTALLIIKTVERDGKK